VHGIVDPICMFYNQSDAELRHMVIGDTLAGMAIEPTSHLGRLPRDRAVEANSRRRNIRIGVSAAKNCLDEVFAGLFLPKIQIHRKQGGPRNTGQAFPLDGSPHPPDRPAGFGARTFAAICGQLHFSFFGANGANLRLGHD